MKLMLLFVAFIELAAAPKGWVRVSTPTFDVLSNAGGEPAAQVAKLGLEIRRALLGATGAVGPMDEGSGVHPATILVLTPDEFDKLRPGPGASGFYSAGKDRDYIAIRAGGDLRPEVFHEYLHLFLNQRGGRLPIWFGEGAAEVFSTARLRNGELRIGDAIPRHIEMLRKSRWPGLVSLFISQPSGDGGDRDAVFYAQSWALVHMLYLNPEYSPKLNRLLATLANGTGHAQAFEEVYGKPIEVVEEDLKAHVRRWNLPVRRIPIEASGPEEASRVEIVTPLEAGVALAGFLLTLGRTEEARQRLAALAQAFPQAAGVAAGLGDLELRTGHPERAITEYSRSIDLGDRTPRVYFQRALLRRDATPDGDLAIADLRRAVELDPNYEEAWQLLGLLLLRAGKHSEAVEPLARDANTSDTAIEISRIEGKLIAFECNPGPPRLIILAGGERVALTVDDPAKVLLRGLADTSVVLACGPMPAREVTVEHWKGDVREITFH